MTEPSGHREVLELVLSRLTGVRKQSGYWMARCPAHEDAKASLSIDLGERQPVVFKCHAGCERDDILRELGLTLDDVSKPRPEWQAEREAQGEWTPRGPAIAVYHYRDEKRALLYDVCRTATKDFPVRVPDPLAKSGWRWRLGDTRRVLYRLPELLAAVESGEPVWITEGEKDADRLAAEGLPATCNPGGAGNWREEYAEVFTDATVTIIADCDAPGRAHARAVARSLETVAAAVEIREAAVGKDVSDHLAAGKALADLRTTREADMVDATTGMPLTRFLAVADEPQRWVVDGILEHGDRLILTGHEGLGKSTLTRQLAVCASVGIHPFKGRFMARSKTMFVDCENTHRKSRRRFRPLAETAASLGRPLSPEGFVIYHLPRGIDLTKDEWAAFLIEQVTAHRPDLLVIGPLYKLHAVDANEEMAARAITDVLDHAIELSDCALVTEAHMAKGGMGAGRHLEPAGSRLFIGWPDQGYGIRPAGKTRRRVSVKDWRGDREERFWPRELAYGHGWTEWPWVVPQEPLPEEPPPDLEDEEDYEPDAGLVEPVPQQGEMQW